MTLPTWLKIGVSVVLLSGAIYCLHGILAPFIVAGILAYAFNPLAKRLGQYSIPRHIASIVIVTFILGFIALVIIWIAPIIQLEVLSFAKKTPLLAKRLIELLTPIFQNLADTLSPSDVQKLKDMVGSYFGDALFFAAKLIANIVGSSLALANLIALIIITPIVCFYMLKDWDKMLESIDHLIPLRFKDRARNISRDIDKTMAGYARGQALICIILASYYSLTLSLIKLEYAMIIGIGTGLLTCIPYVGYVVGIIAAFTVAVTTQSVTMDLVKLIVVFAVGMGLESSILTPRLVGNRINIHPVWIIFAVLAGGHLNGMMGALLAIPIASIIGVLVRHALEHSLSSADSKHLT
jgi:predicted PurR-regulated permease PerM